MWLRGFRKLSPKSLFFLAPGHCPSPCPHPRSLEISTASTPRKFPLGLALEMCDLWLQGGSTGYLSYKFMCFLKRLPDLLKTQWPDDSLRKVTGVGFRGRRVGLWVMAPLVTLYLPVLISAIRKVLFASSQVFITWPWVSQTNRISFTGLLALWRVAASLSLPQAEISKSIYPIYYITFFPMFPLSKAVSWIISFF